MPMTLEGLALQGQATIYDTLAATVGPRIREIRKESIKESFSDFQLAEHRLEPVANIHGILFINDSRSSNINSTWFGLESMTQPVIWIAGGIDGGNDWESLKSLVKKKVKALICLGLDNLRLRSAFADTGISIIPVNTMEEAVHAAYSFGEKDHVVLLSPACASFDQYENFEVRGKSFRAAVKNL